MWLVFSYLFFKDIPVLLQLSNWVISVAFAFTLFAIAQVKVLLSRRLQCF